LKISETYADKHTMLIFIVALSCYTGF